MNLILVVLACLISEGLSLRCLPCQEAECSPPSCCASGSVTLGVCGCCQVCAKAEGETCGGPWATSGSCAAGLRCFRQCGDVEDEEYCRDYGLFNAYGVCVEERKAKLLVRRARAESRVARLDEVDQSLRPAPLCPQSGGPPVWN